MIRKVIKATSPVTSGVPQGFIIGPLLLVLWINAICDVCTSYPGLLNLTILGPTLFQPKPFKLLLTNIIVNIFF